MSSRRNLIPKTPEVISPSPTEAAPKEEYFGRTLRSATRADKVASSAVIPNSDDGPNSDPEKRARTRSRSPLLEKNGVLPLTSGSRATVPKHNPSKRKSDAPNSNGATNGHLQPPELSAGHKYWRELSRSPSPSGLIPIHSHFRSFIHRHEIPRKVLHVSIGFLTSYLYIKGAEASQIHPVLLAALIPIATADIVRHNYEPFNKFYIRINGALMRESEVDGYNGVIWYLLGSWAVLRYCPKDVGVMSVLLLSWCDTAASTFGRLWGRYTPMIRKGKSVAGTLAAMVVGISAAVFFWGYIAPKWGAPYGYAITEEQVFAFQGRLSLPTQVKGLLGWKSDQGTITGNLALGVMSLVTGLIACASEAVDLFGWDDNLTIPVLCGAGLMGFLKVFGTNNS
ncbi:hypothetical protein E6O75_ATG08199 [Venturia nashicola]|uniref:Phosphatidate cytidylyltransferase n=1 Tax=Venturia nashicola TaxID=86259 RepID=A0A4Z1P9H9_9PEZI|nr:hypothetical protein E6O75_ATG08199 [Venturia nashicola]